MSVRAPVWRIARVTVLLVVIAVGLSSCRTKATVDVAVTKNGSGVVAVVVALDASAAAKVGDLSKVVSVDDLRKAGWAVRGPGPAMSVRPKVCEKSSAATSAANACSRFVEGDTTIMVTRPFKNLDQANAMLASLSGPDGPLRDVRLDQSTSFASTRLSAKGTLDLSHGLDTFGDPDLVSALNGKSMSQLATEFNGGQPVDPAAFSLSIQVTPAGVALANVKGATSNSKANALASSTLGATPRSFDVQGSRTHWTRLVFTALAGLALLAAVATVLIPLLPGRSAPEPRRKTRQKHSRHDAWDYVEKRGGVEAPPASRRRRTGRHTRRRGEPPRWTVDEITVDPLETVAPLETANPPDDAPPNGTAT